MSIIAKGFQDYRKLSKAFVAILSAQNLSTASTEAKPQRLTKNLSFREAYDSHIDQASRPLVLLYGWLVAKAKHIHKYGDFYLNKGFDVLHIKVQPDQLLWPVRAQAVVHRALEFASEARRQDQPVLVHGFSVGGYLFGETLVKILQNEQFANVGERLQAQIFDSPVDFDGVPQGVARAVTPVPALQTAIQATLEAYLKVFDKPVQSHYLRSSAYAAQNKLAVPSLFMYSSADPIGVPAPIEKLIDEWSARGIHVDARDFGDSAHVSHYHQYPVEYITLLNSFLHKVGLIQQQERDRNQVSLQD
jgi:hypothetical protein